MNFVHGNKSLKMNHKQPRILVVDDEEDLCEILQFNLQGEGFLVDVAYSAEEALKRDLSKYHLFLLDVMMGQTSGFRLAEHLRKELKIQTPVIFLTAKDTENDMLTGFNLGADDYISKPFSIKEVLARIKAVLRRYRVIGEEEVQSLRLEEMELDVMKKRLVNEGKKTELTPKEFEILKLLLENQGKIFSREDMLSRIWGNDVIVNDRTIDVNIARLRKKMGKQGEFLKNKTGYGYFIEVT